MGRRINTTLALEDRMSRVLKGIDASLKASEMNMKRTADAATRLQKSMEYGYNTSRMRMAATQQRYDRAEKLAAAKHNQAMLQIEKRHQLAMEREAFRASNRRKSILGLPVSGGSSGNLGSYMTGLASSLYVIKSIGDAINSLASIMEKADTATSQKARMGLYNESQYSTNQLYAAAAASALRSRSDLGATMDLSNRLLISGALTGQDAPLQAIQYAEMINKALVAGGSTAEESKRALLQLSQGLASGTLQGDELRSIREQTPYLASIMAQGLGELGLGEKFEDLTIGALKDLGANGELTAERILAAFSAMEEKINADFEKMPKTFGQAMTSMRTLWTVFLDAMNQPGGGLNLINESIWELVDFLSSSDATGFWEAMTSAVNALSIAVSIFIDLVIMGLQWIGDHQEEVAAAFIALGIVGAASGFAVAAAWIAAYWPILLIVAAIALVISIMIKMGVKVSTIIGVIAGAFAWLAKGIELGITNIAIVLETIFQTVANIILALVSTVLKAVAKIGDAFDFLNKGKSSIGDTVRGYAATVEGYIRTEGVGEGLKNPFEIMQEQADAFNSAYDAVKGLAGELEGFDLSSVVGGVADIAMSGMELPDLSNNGGIPVDVKGGKLDDGGTVKLSDDDLTVLKDLATRKYLINLATMTPNVNNYFGDVRETADVNKILEVINKMVEEDLATSLVVG